MTGMGKGDIESAIADSVLSLPGLNIKLSDSRIAFTNHDSSALGSDAVPRTVLPLPLFDNIDNEPVYPV